MQEITGTVQPLWKLKEPIPWLYCLNYLCCSCSQMHRMSSARFWVFSLRLLVLEVFKHTRQRERLLITDEENICSSYNVYFFQWFLLSHKITLGLFKWEYWRNIQNLLVRTLRKLPMKELIWRGWPNRWWSENKYQRNYSVKKSGNMFLPQIVYQFFILLE